MRLFKRLQRFEQLYEIMLSVLVGIISGFVVYLFLWLIDFFNWVFFDNGRKALFFLGEYYVIILPVVGGLIVGAMTHYLAKEVRGHGVPEVIADVALKNGFIPYKVVLVKTFAASICMGSGGSAGRVGAAVHVGSGMGSMVAQLFKVKPNIMRSLVACGAAGGIAASFHAPIGGVLFALEVILGELKIRDLKMIIVSSICAAVTSEAILGGGLPVKFPSDIGFNFIELIFYLLLGIITGMFSFLFIKVFYLSENIFSSINAPDYLKPAMGGLIVGFTGFFYPQVFGVGMEHIEHMLYGYIPFGLLLMLLFLKIIATSITLGSGGSGGIFAPTIYIGAVLGCAFGFAVNFLFPSIVSTYSTYALAGMVGMLSGAIFAPLSGIVLMFEVTNDYQLILPFMLVGVTSYFVTSSLTNYSIYTEKLNRRGFDLEKLNRTNVLNRISVSSVMSKRVKVLSADMTVLQVFLETLKTTYSAFPVVDNDRVIGVLSLKDIKREFIKNPNAKLKNIIKKDLISLNADATLADAVFLMQKNDIGRIPVLETDKLVGIITRSDIVRAYAEAEK